MTIYKYPLPNNQTNRVLMPKSAQLLHVDIQAGGYYVWALVDPSAEKEYRTIDIFGTGWEIDLKERKFINTFLVNRGEFVFHAFERIE